MCTKATETIHLCRVCALILALAFVFACAGALGAHAETDGMIRVKLTRLGAPKTLRLTANCDYYLASDPDVRIHSGDTVTVSALEGKLSLSGDGKTVTLGETARFMRAEPGNRGIKFIQPELSNRFCGDLGLSASGGVITAILNIYIENYLYGVVGYAMPPSAGIEALKAEAVAARTHALYRKSTRSSALYDVTDIGEQVFKGYSESGDYADVLRAVDETRGGVLYSDGSLIPCEVCASNGGQTESSRNAGGPELDYTTVKDDPYDFESQTAVVRTARISRDLSDANGELYNALIDAVRAQLEARNLSDAVESFRLVSIENITACESRFPAPSRLYKSLTFKLNVTGVGVDGTEKTGTISVGIPTYGGFETWYDLSINPEDNETVWVTEDERSFAVSFRRQGSGMGMSQRGAQVMAEKGMRFPAILSFYYPGVEGRQLSLNDTTRDSDGQAIASTRDIIATARLSTRTDLLDDSVEGSASTATVAAGAVVDIYGVEGEWAAVGSSGKFGYIKVGCLESFALTGAAVNHPDEATYGRVTTETPVLVMPDSGAETLGHLAENDTTRLHAWNDQWAMVKWNGQSAFIAMTDVEIVKPGEAAEEPVPTADPETFVDAEGTLNARLKQDAPLFETANELSSTVESLKQGETVQVLAYNRDWARVRTHKGKEGYLRQESIAAVTEKDASSGIEGGEVHRVKGKKFMFVTSGCARVYATWSQDAEVVETLYYGERKRVGAYNSLWACVRVNGENAFIRMEDLSDAMPPVLEGGQLNRTQRKIEATVRQDAEVFESASTGAATLAQLTKGQRVTVAAYNGLWAVVRTEDITGYVQLQHLEKE